MFYINSHGETINLYHVIKIYLNDSSLLATIDCVDNTNNIIIITIESNADKKFLDTFNYFIMRGKNFTNHDVLGYMN